MATSRVILPGDTVTHVSPSYSFWDEFDEDGWADGDIDVAKSWDEVEMKFETRPLPRRYLNLGKEGASLDGETGKEPWSQVPKMSSTRVLILGGHGKISLLLTKILVQQPGWNITSVIRNPEHREAILGIGDGKKGQIEVLVESLDDVKSVDQARQVIQKTDPKYIVWSAGAGGKGGASRTYAIDRDAAKYYIKAAVETPSVTKFLMVSYIGSRRDRAAWWSDEDWRIAQHGNTAVLPDYFKAKVDADEYLAALARKRNTKDDSFQAINLRPGTLSDDSATGRVLLGKTPSKGKVTREDVASVAALLLQTNDRSRWLDLLNGDTDIKDSVDTVIREEVDCIEGVDLERIDALAD